MPELRAIEDQLARVLVLVTPLAAARRPLDAAAGRTLAEPVVAALDLPPFDNSAMDGYAIRTDDIAVLPVALRVAADLPAGSALDPELPPGSAARIMTGAPVPSAADTVVPFERTAGGRAAGRGPLPDTVVIEAAEAGAHIRRRGEDVRAGGDVLPAGIVLGPRQLSSAAAVGVREVAVRPAPRVAVISTGTELTAPGAALTRGRIPESNSALIVGMVCEAGAEPVLVARATDDVDRFRAALADAHAAGADVVVTSGGVGTGAYEVVRDALGEVLEFTEVAVQPGRPQATGRLPDGALVFALPGTPVAAGVVFELFVRPALLALQGRAELHRPRLRLPVADRHRRRPGRTGFRPVAIDRTDPAGWVARPPAFPGSHSLAGFGLADGLVVVPPGEGTIEPGELADVVLLG